jgi:hypothetical protein
MRVLLAGLFVALLTATAHAQSTEPPTFTVGDTWKRSHGQEITVVSIDDKGTVVSGALIDCPTCLARLDKSLNLQDVTDANGKSVDVTRLRGALVGPNWKFYEWPLELNRSWSTSGQGFFQNQPQRYNINLTVRAYEDVKTKAGTFKAYKIEQNWSNSYGTRWLNTVWYAPEVKSVIKFTSNNTNSTDWEMIAYSLK